MPRPVQNNPPPPYVGNVGVMFCDIVNSSALRNQVGQPLPNQIFTAIAKVIQTLGIDLIDLNTWGDAVFATSTDAAKLADLALKIRDVFLHASGANPIANISIRIALDFINTRIAYNPITQRMGCMDFRLTRAARLESVTPANSIFATTPFAEHLADSYSGRVSTGDPHLNARISSAPTTDGPRNLLFCKCESVIRLPKRAGQISVYSLQHANESPGATWPDQKSRLNSVAPMLVDTWFATPETSRHQTAKERIANCKSGEKVFFINITGKSVIFPNLDGGQRLVDHSVVAAAIVRGVKFRGIILDPDSDEALLRSRIETPGKLCPKTRLLQDDSKIIHGIPSNPDWETVWKEASQNLILKRTGYGLSFSLWLFADQAIVEPYHLGKLDEKHMCQFSQFHVFEEREKEFKMLTRHFENLWSESAYFWPEIHGPQSKTVTESLAPSRLQARYAGKKKNLEMNSDPIRLLQLVSNTLKIGRQLQEALSGLLPQFNIQARTERQDSLNPGAITEFLQSARINTADIVLAQVHGIEGEQRLIVQTRPMLAGQGLTEPLLDRAGPKTKVIVYIHRPEELILRVAAETDGNYRSGKGHVATVLRRCHAVVLSGRCSLPEYQEMLPDVLVTSIPLGFSPPEGESVNVQERVRQNAVTFVGSYTTWGEMRHLGDVPQLLEAIRQRDASANVVGYTAGRCDKHCKLDEFAARGNVVLLGNDALSNAHSTGEFSDEATFRNWLYQQAPGKCIFRARQGQNGQVMPEDISLLPPPIRTWEQRLIDFNIQFYYEALDAYREPDRRGQPKVEYSGTLHNGGGHEVFVVFESPAMKDVQNDEGLQMLTVPMIRGAPDYQNGADQILRLMRSPASRVAMLERNCESMAKIGMNEIAFAFYLLCRHLGGAG